MIEVRFHGRGGQSLKKKIESGPLELDEALRIAIQVAEGLQEAGWVEELMTFFK